MYFIRELDVFISPSIQQNQTHRRLVLLLPITRCHALLSPIAFPYQRSFLSISRRYFTTNFTRVPSGYVLSWFPTHEPAPRLSLGLIY